MRLYNKYKDIRYMYPLFNLCKYIGSAPMVSIEEEDFKKCRSYIYPMFLLCFIFGVSVLSFVGKIMVYEQLHITVVVMDVLCSAITALNCVYTIVSISMVKLEKVKSFFMKLKTYDIEHMLVYNTSTDNHCGFFVTIKFEIFIMHVYLLCLCVHNIYFWIGHVGIAIYKYYIIVEILQYQSFVSTFFLKNLICCFKYRFIEINRRLYELRDVCKRNEVGTISRDIQKIVSETVARKSDQQIYNLQYIHKTYKMYNELMLLVNMYNSIFGWQMVLLLVKIKLLLLFTLNLMVVYGDGTPVFGKSFGYNLWLLGIMWVSLILIESVAITWSSHSAAKEGRKASSICYTILQHLYSLPKSWQNDEMTDGIVSLSRLVTDHYPTISAAGFFEINYTTLSTMIGTVTSYLVVLIQLK